MLCIIVDDVKDAKQVKVHSKKAKMINHVEVFINNNYLKGVVKLLD